MDGTYLPVADNFIRVWETDSVSNTQAMKWSTPDDFENKIAMLKWGKSVHGNQPSWSFSYGNEPLDAGLTMAATVATQNVPFESKTPTMLSSVDPAFRQNWFGYVRDHEDELFQSDRTPELAIWYSSATRDFQDYDPSGKFGLYSVTTPPNPDDTWWASRETDSVVTAEHVGGYRGLSAAMIRMNIPYTVVHGRDEGPLRDLSDLDMLILPSVGAMSAADAEAIRRYVQNGGTLLATGVLPGTLDETGAPRANSILTDVFALPGSPGPRVNAYGNGLAIYRPDIIGTRLFGEQLDANAAADTLSAVEQLVRVHVDEPLLIEDGEGIYADRAIADDGTHLVYLVNYSGLQLPLVPSLRTVSMDYRVPDGKSIGSVVASTPDGDGLNGFATVSQRGNGVYRIDVPVDQFALLTIQLENAPTAGAETYAGPQFDDPSHTEAANSGLAFVLEQMRDSTLPEPNRFGVHTNLLDNEDSTAVYTNGHNVTGEHMGLLLRTSACMGNQDAFDEAYRYAGELLRSPLYHVPNWSIDKNRQQPFVFYDDFRGNWYNANAPLDDLRLIHGLIDGYENFGHTAASRLADEMFEGLYWTSVTDRGRNSEAALFTAYPGGLLGFAWDWAETDDDSLTPAASATGTGYLGTDLLPVDYQDLGAIVHAAERDHRWESVLQSTTQLLLDAEIALSGLYYNGYQADGSWTGDFEYQGTRRGEHLKTIQVLWTAIHLARVSEADTTALTEAEKALAQGSAARSLAFFKSFYQSNGRVPEYLTVTGNDVDDCSGGQPATCLARGTENLHDGEARIYAQMARLALLLGDKAFSTQLIDEKLVADRVGDTSDPRYGMIGLSTAGSDDAEAWNVLESVFSICLNALNDDGDGSSGGNNTAPLANTDRYDTNEGISLSLLATALLSNDTDVDNDPLRISGLPSRSAEGGRVELLTSGDWLYTPATGFAGLDTVSYAISDGRGGSAIGQIEITVRQVPKSAHLTDTITITAGTLDYGSVSFLAGDDADTYDIASSATAGAHVVDWFASGRISDPEEVSRLVVTLAGHYSVPDVSQETFLYNDTSGTWDSVDVRTVGDETDAVVRIDVTDNPGDYLAADGETRVRVRSTQPSRSYFSWTNSLQWLAYRGNQATGNRAPLASRLSVSTTTGTAVPIGLSGSDADGDTLSYSIDTSGTTGTVNGTPPTLTYAPPAGFVGLDRFTYTVSDGEASSAAAEVSVSVLQPGVISNIAAAITLDGDLTDWSGYIPFAEDPDDISGADNLLDWRQAWMAHDGTDFYIAYRNDGEISPTWGQTVYIDVDGNMATGLQNGLPLGADRVLQGRFLYRYAGNGTDWNWDFITEVVGASANGHFEYRFPRSALDDSESLQLAFVGSSVPFGGTAEDLYPDGVYDSSATDRTLSYAATVPANSAPTAEDLSVIALAGQPVSIALVADDADGDALGYTITGPPLTGTLSGAAPNLVYTPFAGFTGEDTFSFQVSDGLSSSREATVTVTVQSAEDSGVPNNPVAAISIDGNLSDWQALRFFADDPDDVAGAENPVDYRRAAMAHDAGNVYLTFSNDGQDLMLLEEWLFTVYIDTDLDAGTGYNSGLAIGADIMQQGGSVFTYAGTGPDWTWSALAGTPRQASGTAVELAVPRQAIGDPSQLRLVFIGDNLSVGGGVEDVYPDGAYSDTAAVRYLEYSTEGLPSEPVILAAYGDDQPVSGRELLAENARELTRPTVLAGKSGGGGAIGSGLALWLIVLLVRRGVYGARSMRLLPAVGVLGPVPCFIDRAPFSEATERSLRSRSSREGPRLSALRRASRWWQQVAV